MDYGLLTIDLFISLSKNTIMLQVSYIRDNREQVLERLAVKNFKQAGLVDEILQLDDKRRSTQTSLDNVSAEANAAAKQIGELMRAGKKEEADGLKSKTGTWKEDIKRLGDELAATEEALYQKLVLLYFHVATSNPLFLYK